MKSSCRCCAKTANNSCTCHDDTVDTWKIGYQGSAPSHTPCWFWLLHLVNALLGLQIRSLNLPHSPLTRFELHTTDALILVYEVFHGISTASSESVTGGTDFLLLEERHKEKQFV